MKFEKRVYNKVVKLVKENDGEMMYIYGGDDGWRGWGVSWVKKKKKIKVYVLGGGRDRRGMGRFEREREEEMKREMNGWVNKE